MSEQQFYVYEHWRPDTGTCFYVGKGRARRAWTMSGRNLHHQRLTAKLADNGLHPVVVVVQGALAESEALALEAARVAHWRGAGGALVNILDGGHMQGSALPEQVRLKIGAAHKGKRLSSEHRERLSAAQRRRFSRPDEYEKLCARNAARKAAPATIEKRAAKLRGRKMPQAFCDAIGDRMRGKKVSAETREKLRQAQLGRKASAASIEKSRAGSPQSRPVICLDTGVAYRSASEAARQLGINKSHIAEVCRGGRKRARGLHFCYVSGVSGNGR